MLSDRMTPRKTGWFWLSKITSKTMQFWSLAAYITLIIQTRSTRTGLSGTAWVQQFTTLCGCHQSPHLPLTFIWELNSYEHLICILISLAFSKVCNSVWYPDRSCASQGWVTLNLGCAKLLIESKGGGDSHLFHLNSYTVGFGCTNQIFRKDAEVTMAMILHEVLKTAFLILDCDGLVTCKKLDFIWS